MAVEDNLPAPEVAPREKRLPFAFAKRHGVLIQTSQNHGAEVLYRDGAALSSLAEVRRFLGVPVKFTRVDSDAKSDRGDVVL